MSLWSDFSSARPGSLLADFVSVDVWRRPTLESPFLRVHEGNHPPLHCFLRHKFERDTVEQCTHSRDSPDGHVQVRSNKNFRRCLCPFSGNTTVQAVERLAEAYIADNIECCKGYYASLDHVTVPNDKSYGRGTYTNRPCSRLCRSFLVS